MNIRAWKALARGVILESLRRKDLWVVAILGGIIVAAAGTLGVFGFSGLEVFAKDLAVTVLGLFSTILAVLTTCRLMPEEIKNRTLYPMLARPISRFDLLLGKFLGAVAVSWFSFLILLMLTSCALMLFGVRFELILLQYAVLKTVGLALVVAVTLTLSVVMTPAAAATLSFILAFGSGMIIRALVMAGQTQPEMVPVFKLLNWIMPQYGLFDLGSRVANQNWAMVPVATMLALLIYGVAYATAMLTLGWARFRRRAI